MLLCCLEKPKDEPPEFTKYPENVTVNEKEKVQILCRIVGKPRPTVEWFKGEVTLKESDVYHIEDYEDTYVLEIKEAKPEDVAVYRCMAKNPAGEAFRDIPLEVKEISPVKEEVPLVLKHVEETQPPVWTEELPDTVSLCFSLF